MSNETDSRQAAPLPEEVPQTQSQQSPLDTLETQEQPVSEDVQESSETQQAVTVPQAEHAAPAVEHHVHVGSGSEKAMRFLAATMPWVISLLLHCGVLLILAFMVFMVVPEVKVDQLVIPDSFLTDDPGAQMNPNPAAVKSMTTATNTTRKKVERQITKVSTSSDTTKSAISVIGVESPTAASVEMNMATSSAAPSNKFFGLGGGNAYNVVYVIDGSGSMEISGAFAAVREEMFRSIARLTDKQTFAVILYTAGKPEECSKSLMLANKKNKKKAADFLSGYSGQGLSNPIPALERAFKILRGAKKNGLLIYLLSDGEFKGEGISNDKVLAAIRTMNADRKVNVNTLLFGGSSEDNKNPAVKVMRQIADQNKGQFKHIEWGE